MRNASVVLVFFCIGLASGFVVPSGALELIDDNRAILADNNVKESEEAKRATFQEDNGIVVLPFRTNRDSKNDLETNQNRINDKELYEQDTTNHNNVNERSFIYINQKFKTPVLNQLYSSQSLIRESYKPLIASEDETNYQIPPKYTPSYSMSKPKEEYFEPRSEIKNLYFPPAGLNQQVVNKETTNENHDFTPKKPTKVSDEQREYVELLKLPLLRPAIKSPETKENRLWVLSDHTLSNYHQPLTKHLHVPNSPIDPRQFTMAYYDNFGFPTPYGYQRSIPQFNYKPDGALATDNSDKKVIHENNNVEVSKLLDRYLKETLEDRVTNGRLNVKNKSCNYSSCVLKSTKQYLNSRVKDTECKCGRRLNLLKQRQSPGFEDKETNTDNNLITSSEKNTHPVTPSEIGDYSDMLAEEMNLKKLIED